MAHFTTLSRLVYLFVYFSICIAVLVSNAVADESPVSDTNSSTAQVLSGTAASNIESIKDPNQLTVKQIFDSINFGDGEPAAPTDSTTTTSLQDANQNIVGQSIGNMLISLAFVILIGLIIAWVMRRYVVRDTNLGGGKINLIASYTLSQKSKVYLLRIGSQTFLVGEGSNELQLISEVNLQQQKTAEQSQAYSLDETVEEQINGTHPNGFESKLNQWTNALKSKDMQSEVNTSLLLLGGLAQRLRNKREN